MICKYCNKVITSKYLKDFWGNDYHIEHRGIVSSCSYCGRYISKSLTKGGKRYRDGKYICGICLKNNISDVTNINKEYKYVLDIMAKLGFDLKKYKTEIFLIDRGKSSSAKKEEPGYIKCETTKRNGVVTTISFKIFILKGLPYSYFISTLAHEMMHQWLTLYAMDSIKPELCEGACNYISYLVMERLKTPLSYYVIETMLKDPHPHYGKGFRKVLSYARKHGHNKLIKLLKSKNKI